MTVNKKDLPPPPPSPNADNPRLRTRRPVDLSVRGSTGLKSFGGRVVDSVLPKMSGQQGLKVFSEMATDPTVWSGLYAMRTFLSQAEWRVQPAIENDHAAQQEAAFIEECMQDMRPNTWEMFFSDIMSMLDQGFAPFEVSYKLRQGKYYAGDSTYESDFTDRRIGWRDISLRSQDTIDHWDFDEYGNTRGLVQIVYGDMMSGHASMHYGACYIPRDKMLLFRTLVRANNPQGRALDPNTPIPTPDGWRVLDELDVGSRVFDEEGKIRHVVARQDWDDRPCYLVEFSRGPGGAIIADANHQWVCQSLKERVRRLPGSVRTTQEMAESVKAWRNAADQSANNYSVELPKPLQFTEQHGQILPPYFVGLWLGDGDTNTARISCHDEDAEETRENLQALGLVTSAPVYSDGHGCYMTVYGGQKKAGDGVSRKLTALGLIGNKHIPDNYLFGSVAQREELLAGLMDSDGTIDASGICEFSNSNMNLIDGVLWLVRSLGHAGVKRLRRRPNETNNLKQDHWCVQFRPVTTPFKLRRKTLRVVPTRARNKHYVTSITPVENRRTVCIEVDGPSHLYLAGEKLIPTHNSILRAAVVPYYRRKRLEDINDIGIERDLAGYPVMEVPEELLDPDNIEGAALLQTYYKLITDIRRDEREGAIVPAELNSEGKPSGYKLRLMTSGGTRSIPIMDAVKRYDQRMLGSMLAEFVLLGQDNAGASRSMHGSKKDVFGLSLRTVLNGIAAEINRNLIAPLCALNGVHPDLVPTIEYGDITSPELSDVAQYITALSNVGMDLTDSETERRLREMGDLPDKPDPDSDATKLPPATGKLPQVLPRPSKAPATPRPQDAKPPAVDATVPAQPAPDPSDTEKRNAHHDDIGRFHNGQGTGAYAGVAGPKVVGETKSGKPVCGPGSPKYKTKPKQSTSAWVGQVDTAHPGFSADEHRQAALMMRRTMRQYPKGDKVRRNLQALAVTHGHIASWLDSTGGKV